MVILVLALAACSPPKPPGPAPGSIIGTEAFPGAPGGAVASHVTYASTAPDGSPIVVSALVIVPTTPAPAGGRAIVAWLHPTTGIATGCAPTLGTNAFGQIQGLTRFLSAGDIVVATDYPGLGAPGVHPYLVGVSEARAALDSVRAVGNMADAKAGHRFAVWGHSQGGHAALFVGGIAASYAPDLQLVGVAAAAPVTDIAALIGQQGDNPLWGGLLSYTVASWSQVFGLDQAGIVVADTEPAISQAAKDCLQNGAQLDRLVDDAAPLAGQPVTPTGRWQTLLSDNAPQPWATGVPVFLAQGAADPIVDPASTRGFAQRLCQAGVPVKFLSMRRVDHYLAAVRSANAAADWIAKRFAAAPPPDDCARLM